MQALYRYIQLTLCFLLLSVPGTWAQDSVVRQANVPQWQQLTADKAFGYKNDIEWVPVPKPAEKMTFLEDFFRALGKFLSSGIWSMLLWIIVIGAVGYFIYMVALNKNNFMFARKKKNIAGTNDAGSTENFALTDWEQLTQQAVSNNDLRMATRYRYMWLLQILQEKQLIQYREDKTNFEYYTELSASQVKQPFRKLSRQYEFAFYGNYTPTPTAYNEYAATFNTVKQQLGK